MDDGLKILLKTYWDSNGWKDGSISKNDFEIAKQQGYMFDYPKYNNHNQFLSDLKELVSSISADDVANAFLYSLSTRDLKYRSSLSSYYYAKSIPIHIHDNDNRCGLCGYSPFKKQPSIYDLKYGYNVLNFERYKWGGVRHSNAEYAFFDLTEFSKLTKVKPSNEDKIIFVKILDAVKSLSPSAKAGAYCKEISKQKILKSNVYEIKALLAILSICDVFNSTVAKGFLVNFTPYGGGYRNPPEETNDTEYPLSWWHANDGVNKIVVNEIFGIDIT